MEIEHIEVVRHYNNIQKGVYTHDYFIGYCDGIERVMALIEGRKPNFK